MRLIHVLTAASALAFAAPALAQAVAPGMQIVDSTGAAVGTVTAVQGTNLLVKTDKVEALLPRSSFTVSNGKLLFGMTQAQLDAAIQQQQAAAAASIAVGATAKGMTGAPIGKIAAVTDTDVIIAVPSGQKVQIPRKGVRGNTDGTVTVGLTAEQLDAQLKGSAPPPAAAPAAPAPTPTH